MTWDIQVKAESFSSANRKSRLAASMFPVAISCSRRLIMHPARRFDAIAEPGGERPATSTHFETPPSLGDAKRLKPGDAGGIPDLLDGGKTLALLLPGRVEDIAPPGVASWLDAWHMFAPSVRDYETFVRFSRAISARFTSTPQPKPVSEPSAPITR
jgi:hypothetical protein